MPPVPGSRRATASISVRFRLFLVMPSRSSPSPSVVSLYTGAGGLDLGFEAAGCSTRVAIEMDADAVTTLRANRPEWAVIHSDIHAPAGESARILDAAGLRAGDADVLIGGPPCQPFSKSGYWARGDARRLDDPRARTLEAYLRVLRDTQPRTFLLENVPGLAFSEKDEGLQLLRRSIDTINRETGSRYSFQVAQLRAVEYGVPQDRERVFVVGARDGTDFSFPKPTHDAPSMLVSFTGTRTESSSSPVTPHAREAWRTTWDAIGDLEGDDDPALKVGGKWADLLPSIPEGSNYLYHTSRGGGMPLFGWRRRYWSFLLKLSRRLPAWTLTAEPGSAIGPFHWRNRRLSVAEMKRLQTFPDAYEITGSYRAALRQLGNAVPSALGERLALEIRRQLLGHRVAADRPLSLSPARRTPTESQLPVASVPDKYHSLVGEHEAHPGTGRGYAAIARTVASR